MNNLIDSFALMHSLSIKAKAELKRKDKCPVHKAAKAKALEEWHARGAIQDAIKGLGRNDKCPTHGTKIKKCGCLKAAHEKIEFDGRQY